MSSDVFCAFSFIRDGALTKDDFFTILYLRGECDLATVAELEAACDRVPGDRRLIIDVVDLDFIDCVSLGILERLAR